MGVRTSISKIVGMQHPHDKVVEILTHFGHRGRLLDAPAGDGAISQRLKAAGFDVVAADINPQRFDVEGILCQKADLNQPLPFENESFDFILSSNGIEHLEAPFHFVRECFRILKGRGKLLITTPNTLNLKSRLTYLLIGFNLFMGRPCNEVDLYQGGGHIHLTNYYELRINLHRNGFRVIDATTHMFSNTAMFLFPIYPFIYLMTDRAFRREKRPLQRERNRETFRHVLSADLIFGKKLFLTAEKDPGYQKNT
jgi:2-polyprenyl-3-methyl-5-hydroxy-6-metoxy-1,4-benzoquinol methylase